MSEKKERVWLLTTTHDDLVAGKPDTQDLLAPGRAFATQEAAKKAAQDALRERLRELQEDNDAEHTAKLEAALKKAPTKCRRINS